MSTSFNPNIPADTDTVYDAYFSFRSNMLGLNNLIGVDHVDGTDANSAQHGMHKKVSFVNQNKNKVIGTLSVDEKTENLMLGSSVVALLNFWKMQSFSLNPLDGLRGENGYLSLPNGLKFIWFVDSVPANQIKQVVYTTGIPPNIRVRNANFACCFRTNLSQNNKFTFNYAGFDVGGFDYQFDIPNSVCAVQNRLNGVSIGVFGLVFGT